MNDDLILLPRCTPPQAEFLALRGPRRTLVGGVGSGKTHTGVLLALLTASRLRGSTGALCAPSYAMLEGTLLATWRALVPSSLWHLRVRQNLIELANGSSIRLLSLDRAESRIKGLNISYAIADEVAVLPTDNAMKMLGQRIRAGAGGFLAALSTPTGNMWFQRWSRNGAVVKTPTNSNPYLPADYIRRLEQDFPPGSLEWRRELGGEFVSMRGLVYGDVFDEKANVVDQSFDASSPSWLGFDPGSRASAVVLLQRRKEGFGFVVVKQWLADAEFTETTCDRIVREVHPRNVALVSMDTPSQLSSRAFFDDLSALREYFGQDKVSVTGTRERRTENRRRTLRKVLAARMLCISRDLVPGHRRGLFNALTNFEYQTSQSRDERTPDKSELKHVIDALEFIVTKIRSW